MAGYPRSAKGQISGQSRVDHSPFDIQEIPDAMRREMMPVGAKLMERWFAGRLNYSPNSPDSYNQVHAIDQNGKPYARDMYDYSIVKLDWVLKHRRAKEAYDQLIETAIYSSRANDELRKKLTAYYDFYGLFRAAEVFKDDVKMMHELFQFQRATVDGGLADKIKSFMYFAEENKGVPDDLFAAPRELQHLCCSSASQLLH